MARLGVHVDKQGVVLLPAAAHEVLEGGDKLEGVKRDHAVIMVCGEEKHGWVLDAICLWQLHVVQWRVSERQRHFHEARYNMRAVRVHWLITQRPVWFISSEDCGQLVPG